MKLNLPNKITLSRIFLSIIMVVFYLADFIPFGKLISMVIFIVASCTDFVDGNIARKRNMVTNLGKLLDPIADKLLVTSALIMVIADGTIPAPYGVIAGIIVIGRDLIIGALRQVAAASGKVLAADKWGKLKTIFLDIAIPMVMSLAANVQSRIVGTYGSLLDIYTALTFIMLAIGLILSLYSGANYVIKNKSVFEE